jgi:Chaperone of endosialidase/Secretion system C-terminal sorting domain
MKTFTITCFILLSLFPYAKAQNTFPSTGNVGIGTTSPTSTLAVIGRVSGLLDTTWGVNAWQSLNDIVVNGAGSKLTNQFQYAGTYSTINLNLSSNFSDFDSSRPSNFTGLLGTVYKSDTGALTLGVASGVTGYLNVSGTGGMSEYANFRSASPQTAYPLSYSGTITNFYGLLLDSSGALSRGISSKITHPYGIYQSGTSDINYFAGKIGIGTKSPSALLTVYNGTTTGTYTTSGWVSSSDGRLKTNVRLIDSAMDIVNKLNGVYFEWKNGSGNERQLGFIAQDVKKVLPEAVSGKEGDLAKGESLSMGYQNIVPVLVEALKEQDQEITNLKHELDSLEQVVMRKLSRLDSMTTASNFKLDQNIPNPFTNQTMIPYTINKSGFVKTELYTINGTKLATLESANKEKGTYTIAFDGSDLASGIYVYTVSLNGKVQSRKAIKL